ncbi:MAG: CBS domain-containing protein [Acidovorax sp.]|nr:CBS domain-containing protein [Comamonas sp.]MBP7940268.1 CBS domain-containing protein [Comamonas sp.]MBP8226001.1 CBS domain-containing protein [Acidovorax sp.]HRN30776.1 CBS domain-containing protein [Comamonas denitrificans]
MSDSHPERDDKRSFWQKFQEFLHPSPDTPDALIETLAEAEDKAIISPEALAMLEGVIRMADRTAGDIMVPAPRMDVLDIHAPFEALLDQVIRTAHSRFPVYEGARENIIGVLMAKDLLKLQRSPTLKLRALLRPVNFIPETKGLYDLLREFRSNHYHLSIVVDEFGNIAGLVTMEDVLEQIVGEIEDEFDTPDEEGDIFALADGSYRVAGDLDLSRAVQAFDLHLPAHAMENFDTLGGYVAHTLGHVPRRGQVLQWEGLELRVLLTKGGAVRWFQVRRPEAPATDTAESTPS